MYYSSEVKQVKELVNGHTPAIKAKKNIELSREHVSAVNRKRRIIVHYDTFVPMELIGIDIEKWIDFRFGFADEEGSQIDSIWIDMAFSDCYASYPSKVLPRAENTGMRQWWDKGVDFIGRLVEETKKRGLEVFWHHRISEVDMNFDFQLEMETRVPIKAEHPDWLVKSWWWQGLWNLEAPGLREYKVKILHELALKYDFDGFQIDFARHMPCLTVGKQWEKRENVTEFIRMVRLMLLEVEKKKGKPVLLAAKVPENLEGCKTDGLDVETWAKNNLVDMFSLGSRTINVDIDAFRRITSGKCIKLYPTLDDHHATDGYKNPSIEFFRGVFSNWYQQGADGVETFNWGNATPEVYESLGVTNYESPPSHQQAYHEIGSSETLRYKDKIYVAERKGVFPWSEGYFCRNEFAPLPAKLDNDGRTVSVPIYIYENIITDEEYIRELSLNLVIYGISPEDVIKVGINCYILDIETIDYNWKDSQIHTPNPQPPAGSKGHSDHNQQLAWITFKLKPEYLKEGENKVNINIIERKPFKIGSYIQLEKAEIHLKYDV